MAAAAPMWRALTLHLSPSGPPSATLRWAHLAVVTVQRPPLGAWPVAEGPLSGCIVVGGGAAAFFPSSSLAGSVASGIGGAGMVALRAPAQRALLGLRPLQQQRRGNVCLDPQQLYNPSFPLGPTWPYAEILDAVYEGLLHGAAEWRRSYRLVSWICGLSVGISIAGVVCLDLQAEQASLEAAASASAALDGGARGAAPGSSAASALASADLAARLVRKNSRSGVEEAYTLASADPIGEGSFGVVFRGVHNRTGIERAVKCIDKQDVPDLGMLRREVEAQSLMDHPHVCRLVEYFETGSHLWLVTELCRGGELCGRLEAIQGGLPEAEASLLMSQILRATLHCHSRAVIHRDLKPENFLFADLGPCAEDGSGSSSSRGALARRAAPADERLKLIDFGFALISGGGSASSASTTGAQAAAAATAPCPCSASAAAPATGFLGGLGGFFGGGGEPPGWGLGRFRGLRLHGRQCCRGPPSEQGATTASATCGALASSSIVITLAG
mmetsp:Transcript_14/g.100  ORF Transcript_14/g.100 Transcript_14/m.100 type:complete len:501 (+) Transcript_14:158-1660(+)